MAKTKSIEIRKFFRNKRNGQISMNIPKRKVDFIPTKAKVIFIE